MTEDGDGYNTVRLPEELMEEIRKVVDNRDWGYRSKAEFVAEAARLLLRQHYAATEGGAIAADPPGAETSE